MGEYSKRIGEIGEEIVADFLDLIGWKNLERNFDIPSVDPEKHKKNSHGIDAFFHYRSPMITSSIENIIISSKFSNDGYPTNLVAKFKDYYRDVAVAIESFKKSELRVNTLNQHNQVETAFDRGIIFWLNNTNEPVDLILKLARIETPKDLIHDGIFLVDNRRVEFIFDSIHFAKNGFQGSDLEFVYFPTGLNNDNMVPRNGRLLPVQYIASSVIPIRVQNPKNKDTTLILSTIENFNKEDLIKLMGLAKNLGNNLQVSTMICFPDYNRVNHEQIVNNTKQVFNDPSFTEQMNVANYNITFRG